MTLQQICEKYKIYYGTTNFIEVLKNIYYSIDPKGFLQAIQDEEVNKVEDFFNFRPVCQLDEKINWYIDNALPLNGLDETRTSLYKASAEYEVWKFFNEFLRKIEDSNNTLSTLDKKDLQAIIMDAAISNIVYYGRDDETENLRATRTWWNEIKEAANKHAQKKEEENGLDIAKDLVQRYIDVVSLKLKLIIIIAVGILCGIEFDF